jgi:hypothetical protein
MPIFNYLDQSAEHLQKDLKAGNREEFILLELSILKLNPKKVCSKSCNNHIKIFQFKVQSNAVSALLCKSHPKVENAFQRKNFRNLKVEHNIMRK